MLPVGAEGGPTRLELSGNVDFDGVERIRAVGAAQGVDAGVGGSSEPGGRCEHQRHGGPRVLQSVVSKTFKSGQYAHALLMWGDGGWHPEGDYTLLYDGEGTVEVTYNAQVKSTAPGKIVVFVKGDKTAETGKGVSMEYIIKLCNRANFDPWINIPPHADDDYIRNAWKGDINWLKAHPECKGIRYGAYEGGLDIWMAKQLILPVRRDPRIKGLYKTYYENWKADGGAIFMHYTFCDEAWGILESMSQDPAKAYQYQATVEFINANPMWWTETARLDQTSASGSSGS